jgi:uncharacterized protein (DUF4415 family)
MSKGYNKPMTPKQARKLADEDIDLSDIPEMTDEFFKNARLLMPTKKKQVTLRLDEDVIAWFKAATDKGYQGQMNAVLRAYMASQKTR